MILSFIFGLAILAITPPFQGPDEYNHFFRAYGITQGIAVPMKVAKTDLSTYYTNFDGSDVHASVHVVGSYVPKELVSLMEGISQSIQGNQSKKQDSSLIIKYLTVPRGDLSDQIFASYPNTALYSPIPYIPSITGIVIGNLFHLSYLATLYLARLFNLIAYISIVYYALKRTQRVTLPMLLLALMPTSLFLGSVTSPDAVVISLSFLIISYADSIKPLKTLDFILILISSLCLGLSKSAYVLLPGIFILGTFDTAKLFKRFVLSVSPLLLSLFGMFIWQYLSYSIFIPLRSGIDPFEQLNFISKQPLTFIHTLIVTVIGNRNYILNQFVGNLGWLDVPLSLSLCYIYVLILAISVYFSNNNASNTILMSRLAYLVIATISGVGIAVLMYMSWTPVGHPEILGLVGKNFIPISLYGLATFQMKPQLKHSKLIETIISLAPIPMLSYTITQLIGRYY